MRKILFITDGYPTEAVPVNAFVDKLVCAIADCGIECIVISPVSVTGSIVHKEELPPRQWIRKTNEGNTISIYCPRYVSFSEWKIAGISAAKMKYDLFARVVLKEIKKCGITFDAVYAHFIYPAGMVASMLGKKYNVPAYFAYGENTDYNLKHFGMGKTSELVKDISAVVSVSTQNKEELIQNKIIDEAKIRVFPNGIDSSVFYPRNKAQMRNKHGFAQEDFIVAFVGYFIHIKGADRLSDAIDHMGGIKSIFIGKGPVGPTCEGIVFKGQVPHEMIPELLSAADIFVLPTLAEGCCNAIIEAMACGLPIISSDLPFNYDTLNHECALLIDPTQVQEIEEAILLLKEDLELRAKMSKAAIVQAKKLDIKERAKNIIRFLEEMA